MRSCRHLREHGLLEAEHLEDEVGAHVGARRAARATWVELGVAVAHVVHRDRHREHAGWARGDAQVATLAVLEVDRHGAAALDRLHRTLSARHAPRSSPRRGARSRATDPSPLGAPARWTRCAACDTAGSIRAWLR